MKKWLVIFGTVFVVSALTGWVVADDVDDVYYWPDDRPAVVYSQPTQVTVTQTTQVSQTTQVTTSKTITYIEDSVTQHSDTIVKAVIHR